MPPGPSKNRPNDKPATKPNAPLTKPSAHWSTDGGGACWKPSGLQRKSTPAYAEKMARLLELSQHPERTERFIGKSATTNADFTNVGGIDIELCHLRGFYPEFSICA